MQTFYMLGKFSQSKIRDVSSECTQVVERFGGEIILMNALLGPFDVAMIVHFPKNMDAMKASLALQKSTGIQFTTCPAIPTSDFDKITGEL